MSPLLKSYRPATFRYVYARRRLPSFCAEFYHASYFSPFNSTFSRKSTNIADGRVNPNQEFCH